MHTSLMKVSRLPKIVKISLCLSKLELAKVGASFLRHSVISRTLQFSTYTSASDKCVRGTHFPIARAHVTFNAPRARKVAVSAVHTTARAKHTEKHDRYIINRPLKSSTCSIDQPETNHDATDRWSERLLLVINSQGK